MVAREPIKEQPGQRRAHPVGALEVEPRGVEDETPQLGRLTLIGPQRRGQTSGGVGRDHDVVVRVALDDAPPRHVEVGEVLPQVADVQRGLVRSQ